MECMLSDCQPSYSAGPYSSDMQTDMNTVITLYSYVHQQWLSILPSVAIFLKL